jgi:hypothetical protein
LILLPRFKFTTTSPLLLSSWPAVLAWHYQRYPLLEARDIYKLIHQGVFGPGHIVASAAGARQMLKEELTMLEACSPKSKERMPKSAFEPLDPKNTMVRVNLRSLLEDRGRTKTDGWLAAALVESARKVAGDPMQMRRRLAAAVRWCRQNVPGQAEGLERLATQARKSGYPAFHHSPAYQQAYRPAYRVVLNACLRPHRVSGRVD